MNRDQWSGDERALYDALQQLIEDRFSGLSPQQAGKIFDAVLDNFPSPTEVHETSSGWTGRIDSGVVRPLFPNSSSKQKRTQGGTRPSVELTVDSPPAIKGVLHQVMEVGALLVQLDPRPELNELVEMNLEFPGAHLRVETEGRVVYNSNRGTAIEVSGLSREDRVALQAIRDDLEETKPKPDQTTNQRTRAPERRGDRTLQGTGISVNDSVQEPGAVPPAHTNVDPQRSFAPLGGRSKTGRTHQRGQGRRMVQSTMRRRVDLPDPDMNVATSTKRVEKAPSKTTREFYGPPPEWLDPAGDADRIEELASERVVDILLQLSENGFTGLLVLNVEGQDKEQLVFDGGYVVERSIKPRVTQEELGPMLLAADRITKRQLAMAAAQADELDMTVARSLMNLDILNPEELRHAIAGRLTFLLREFCSRDQGAVHIYDSAALPAGFLPQPPLRVHVAVERIIYDRFHRRLSQYSTTEREEQMQRAIESYPEIIEHERDRLERAVTADDQLRLLEQTVTGQKRMREVFTESVLPPSETFAALFSLHRMGLVRFDRSLHDTVVRERLRENITVKYLSVHKASYFEVLNVHWSSYSEAVEQAYKNLIVQFDPKKVPDELEDEVHQKVEEINERVEAAYAALAKRKTRHAYRTRIMPEYKLDHAIPLFLKQGELAERRKKWVDARDSIRRVLEIAPDHKEAQRKLEKYNEILDGQRSPDPADTSQ